VDAGQVRGGQQARFVEHALHGARGPLAGGTAGTVGYRDEIRPQRLQPRHGLPQPGLHLVALGWKELERDSDLVADVGAAREAELVHQANSPLVWTSWDGSAIS